MQPIEVPDDTLRAALYYASLGWPVFRCDTQKKPLRGSAGFRDATVDSSQIADWWIQSPACTIGIATGQAMRSRLLVIDADSYKPGGTPEWDELVADHGMPRTLTVRTGQGGTQYYFVTGEPLRSATGVLPNVDVRGDGGYVIAPPSVTAYGAYTVTDDTSPAQLPEWIAEIVRRPAVAPGGGLVTSDISFDSSTITPEERQRLDHYVDRTLQAVLAPLRDCRRLACPDRRDYVGPPWDQSVFEAACVLVELANSPWASLTEFAAYDILQSESPRDAGFTDVTVLAKWDSARRAVGQKARPVPENPVSGGFFIPTPGAVGGVIDPAAFFSKGDGLNANLLAQAVMDLGPMAIEDAEDRSIWAYRSGVWCYAPNELQDRCTIVLGSRFRPTHVATIRPIVARVLSEQRAVITSEPLPEYINCRNGMLHWSTGVLYPHDPSFYSTVQLPVEWDPMAQCPGFDLFTKQVMADDAVDYLWEILGYMVYSGNPLQRAFLFHGNGSNGKGTLIRVLTGILGPRNCSSVTLTDIAEGRFEVAQMVGKIANLAGDIDAAYMRSTAKLKAITGEDVIQAQRKFQTPFSFKCWATPLFSANEFWRSVDTSQGYLRRWQIVSFPNTFAVTPGLSETFESEYAGILARAVEALRRLMSRGRFDEPESARREKDRFERAADQVLEWITDDPAVVVCDAADHKARCTVPDAYRHYRNWCESSGCQPVSASRFRQRLLQAGYTIRKSNGYWRISGLRLSLQRPPLSGVSWNDDPD